MSDRLGVDLDLEGVWNIRKNVSVAKSKLNQPVYPLTTGSYSRHGAVATKGVCFVDILLHRLDRLDVIVGKENLLVLYAGQSTNSRHDDFSFSPSSVRGHFVFCLYSHFYFILVDVLCDYLYIRSS